MKTSVNLVMSRGEAKESRATFLLAQYAQNGDVEIEEEKKRHDYAERMAEIKSTSHVVFIFIKRSSKQSTSPLLRCSLTNFGECLTRVEELCQLKVRTFQQEKLSGKVSLVKF